MKMTIDLAMNNLSGILAEATEGEDSVCYVTKDDAETLQVAIDTMRKYQKIQEIIKDHDADTIPEDYWYIDRVREVIKHGNDDC